MPNMTLRHFAAAVAASVILSGVPALRAAEADEAKPAKAPETPAAAASPAKKEIEEVQTEYCDAFNKADAKTMANLFTNDADWIDDQGTVIRGRAAIQRALQDAIGGQRDRTLKLRLDSVRPLGHDVVVGNALATVSGGDRQPESGTYIAVYVKQDGKWKIALLTETNEVEDDE